MADGVGMRKVLLHEGLIDWHACNNYEVKLWKKKNGRNLLKWHKYIKIFRTSKNIFKIFKRD